MTKIKVVKDKVFGGYEASYGSLSIRHPKKEFATKALKSMLKEMKGWRR